MKIGGKAVYLQSITTCKLASAACRKDAQRLTAISMPRYY